MRKHTNLIFTLLLAAAAMTACVEDADKELAKALPEPTVVISDITCTSFKASWKSVTDAGSYTYVFDAGEETEIKENSVTFNSLFPNKAYTLAVRTNAGTNGDYTDSKFVTIRVVTEDYSTLSAPEPVLVSSYASKTIIRWNSVYGATGYEYTVGDFSGKTESCTVEIGGLEAETDYVFEIKAVSDDEFVNESPEGKLTFRTRPASEDIPQIILAHIETGSDYSKFNVYAVADTRYLYFGVPSSYFEKHTDTQIRDYYLAAFVKAIEDAGMTISSGIQQYTYTGTASFTEYPLYPEMSYRIVAFGVNTSGQATTPLYKFETKTLAEDTAPIPDVEGEPWFTQSLYHYTTGIYNASNSMWVHWKGQDITEIRYLMTSTRSYKLYFDNDPELFRRFVLSRGSQMNDAKSLSSVNSEKGFSTRFLLDASTSYTLGALAVNSANDTTFTVNSLPTKASEAYYDWVQIELGTTEDDSASLTGVFSLAYTASEGDLNLQLKDLRYYFCPLSELSGTSTDRAAEIVAAKGTDSTQSNLDIINITGKLSLSFDGASLEAGTDYILLATFTERSGSTATRFATAKTAGGATTKSAAGTPKARIKFNTPVLIDTYSPAIGDEF